MDVEKEAEQLARNLYQGIPVTEIIIETATSLILKSYKEVCKAQREVDVIYLEGIGESYAAKKLSAVPLLTDKPNK